MTGVEVGGLKMGVNAGTFEGLLVDNTAEEEGRSVCWMVDETGDRVGFIGAVVGLTLNAQHTGEVGNAAQSLVG